MSSAEARVVFPGATVEISGVDGGLPLQIPDGIPGSRYGTFGDGTVDGSISLEHGEPDIVLDSESWQLSLTVPEEGFDQGPQVLYLAQGLAEGIRQPRGIFLMHAAATVSPEGRGHLIVGKEGYGKTSTMLALCLQQGHKMIGNDLVLLQAVPGEDPDEYQFRLIGGTNYIHLRKTALNANPSLAAAADKAAELGDTMSDGPSFTSKVRIDGAEFGIEAPGGSVPLSAVWHIWLDGRNDDGAAVSEQSTAVKTLFFSERMARHISGIVSPLMLTDGQAMLFPPSFDTPAAQRQRLRAANHLVSLCKLLTGPEAARAAELIVKHE